MDGSKNLKPSNTTKKVGIVGTVVGVTLFVGAAIIFVVGFILKLDVLYIAIFATFIALGTLSLLIGVGMLFQGRKVDKLLSGIDLIASWNYASSENYPTGSGYIYVGTKDVYKNGVYTVWRKNCTLENVFLSEKNPLTLTFQYILLSHRSDMSSTRAVRKRLKVPVPLDKKGDAIRVVEYYKQQLHDDGS